MFDGEILGEITTNVATILGITGIGLIATQKKAINNGCIRMANNSNPKRRDNYSIGNICDLEGAKRKESRVSNER